MSNDRVTVEIELELLKAIFDLAVNSLNFGSGFWDKEETDIARAVAVLIGVDPRQATPDSMIGAYPHRYDHGLTFLEGSSVFGCRYQGCRRTRDEHAELWPAEQIT